MFDSCRDMETSSHFLWVSTETRIPTSSTIDAGSSSKRVKSKIVSCQLGFEVPASIFWYQRLERRRKSATCCCVIPRSFRTAQRRAAKNVNWRSLSIGHSIPPQREEEYSKNWLMSTNAKFTLWKVPKFVEFPLAAQSRRGGSHSGSRRWYCRVYVKQRQWRWDGVFPGHEGIDSIPRG